MSVYKRPGQEVYSYDFRYRGHRFSGSTDCTSKREAQKVEDRIRQDLKARTISPNKPMTVLAATTRYWEEVGQFLANAADVERSLA